MPRRARTSAPVSGRTSGAAASSRPAAALSGPAAAFIVLPPAWPGAAGTSPAGTSRSVSQRAGAVPAAFARPAPWGRGVLFFRTPFRDIDSPADMEAFAFRRVNGFGDAVLPGRIVSER